MATEDLDTEEVYFSPSREMLYILVNGKWKLYYSTEAIEEMSRRTSEMRGQSFRQGIQESEESRVSGAIKLFQDSESELFLKKQVELLIQNPPKSKVEQ